MNNISEHISYQEATKSETAKKSGLDNTPNEQQIENMKLVAKMIFEPLRIHLNVPLFIWSFFRSKKVNKKVGGSATSEHMQGKAIDIDAQIYGGTTNKEIFDYIKDNLVFNQLIWEFGTNNEPDWVHVSYSYPYNKKQILRAIRNDKGKTQYINYE